MGRRTEMDDVEQHTADGDPEILRKKTQPAGPCYVCCMVISFALVMAICLLVPIEYYRGDAHYSVAIDSASGSGLNPMTTGLSFNLTLGVASHSHGAKACINPGLYAEVYYHGVQLATSPPQAERLCAEPTKAAEKRVLAMAIAVPLQGRVMDSLMAAMKQEAAVFDVALHIPAGSYGGMASYYGVKWVSTCKGMRVGAAAAMCDSPDQEELFA